MFPDESSVIVAYYKKENWDWIKKYGLYNLRAGSARGSLRIGPREAGAKYILLHSKNETTTGILLKITEIGPRIFSKQTLIKKGYPSGPKHDYYLVYNVEEVQEVEFKEQKWDITKLDGYKKGRQSAHPFSVTLKELIKAKK